MGSRTRHCSICERCIERYDHHCPWINNCIGIKNHNIFYSLIIFLAIHLLTNIAMEVISLVGSDNCFKPIFFQLICKVFEIQVTNSETLITVLNITLLIIIGALIIIKLLACIFVM